MWRAADEQVELASVSRGPTDVAHVEGAERLQAGGGLTPLRLELELLLATRHLLDPNAALARAEAAGDEEGGKESLLLARGRVIRGGRRDRAGSAVEGQQPEIASGPVRRRGPEPGRDQQAQRRFGAEEGEELE